MTDMRNRVARAIDPEAWEDSEVPESLKRIGQPYWTGRRSKSRQLADVALEVTGVVELQAENERLRRAIKAHLHSLDEWIISQSIGDINFENVKANGVVRTRKKLIAAAGIDQ